MLERARESGPTRLAALALALLAGAGLVFWALADGGSESGSEVAGSSPASTAGPSTPDPAPSPGDGAEKARGDRDDDAPRKDRNGRANRRKAPTGQTQDSASAGREPAQREDRKARPVIEDLLGTGTGKGDRGESTKPPPNLAETLLGGAGGGGQSPSKPPRGELDEVLGIDTGD
jgi:hypothetical protein